MLREETAEDGMLVEDTEKVADVVTVSYVSFHC